MRATVLPQMGLAAKVAEMYNYAMHRSVRLGLGVLVLLLLVAGTALATRAPGETAQPAAPASSHEAEDDQPIAADAAARIAERLVAAGIETDAATVSELADLHGTGNAVRLLAWADASGRSVGEIAAMRAEGMGWGRLARELDPDGSLGLHPGIGWIMGRGQDDAAGAAGAGGPPRHPLGGPPGQQGSGAEGDDDGS